MLLAALGATIVGFVLLVLALVFTSLWLAIACVIVSVAGVGLLLADVLTYRRAERDEKFATRFGSEGDSDGGGSDDGGGRKSGGRVRRAAVAESTGLDTEGESADTSDADAAPAGDDEEESESPDGDAATAAAAVGNESFGHHDTDTADDSSATTQFAAAKPDQDWSHESPADTDRKPTTGGLYAPGSYDPDMTDQIPQIEIERAWGTEWEPPEGTGSK